MSIILMNKKLLFCILFNIFVLEKAHSMTLPKGYVLDGNGMSICESIDVTGDACIGNGNIQNDGGALVYNGIVDKKDGYGKMTVNANKTLTIKSDGQFLNEKGEIYINGIINNEGLFVNQGTIIIQNTGTLSCTKFGTGNEETIGGILNLSKDVKVYEYNNINTPNKITEGSSYTQSSDATIVCTPGATISGTNATINGGTIDLTQYNI